MTTTGIAARLRDAVRAASELTPVVQSEAHSAFCALTDVAIEAASALDTSTAAGVGWREQAALWHDDQYAQARDDAAKFSEERDWAAMRGASSWGNFHQTTAVMLRRGTAAKADQTGKATVWHCTKHGGTDPACAYCQRQVGALLQRHGHSDMLVRYGLALGQAVRALEHTRRAFANDHTASSLHDWNERMKAADTEADGVLTWIAAQDLRMETGALAEIRQSAALRPAAPEAGKDAPPVTPDVQSLLHEALNFPYRRGAAGSLGKAIHLIDRLANALVLPPTPGATPDADDALVRELGDAASDFADTPEGVASRPSPDDLATANLLRRAAERLGNGGWRSAAASDVLAERARQVTSEGWTLAHDDEHDRSELAMAAAVYASPVELRALGEVPCGCREAQCPHTAFPKTDWQSAWPFEGEPKRKDRRRDLVRAGALILAEIERLDRASPPVHKGA